ncbi:hypothetical protein ES703_03525 [subsurface metagenome]
MTLVEKIKIIRNLPESSKIRASELVYEAFQKKINSVIKEKEKAIRIITKSINYSAGFYAVYENSLVGMAGTQSKGNRFIKVKFSYFHEEYGFFKALIKKIYFNFDSLGTIKKDELELTALSVQKEMRWKKIGTKLINNIILYAKSRGFKKLILTVVDTNPLAKKLYETIGFIRYKTKNYGFLTRSAGFKEVTHMVKNLN